MIKAVRLSLALCALAVPAVFVAGCGGVPGNAVAEVDGTSIDKSEYNHWLTSPPSRARRAAAGGVPKPPDYTACIAAKRKTTPKPAKGQPKVTDEQLKTQCKQEYEQLRNQVMQLLVSFQWLEGEAKAQGIKVSDADVKKAFATQKKQSFPKDADYQKFLKTSSQTEDDILLQVKADLLATKIRDKVVKGKDKVSDAQIQEFYDKNKTRFAQPERRDLNVVLTKTKAKAEAGQEGARVGQVLEGSQQEVLDRLGLQGAGRQAARAGQGHARGSARQGRVRGQEGQADRPGQDLRSATTSSTSSKITPASQQSLAQAKDDDQADAAVPEPAEGAGEVLQGLLEALEGEDGLPQGLRDPAVQAGSEGHADADATAARRCPQDTTGGTGSGGGN